MKKLILGLAFSFCCGNLFADTYNNISIQGQLIQATPIEGVKVEILVDGQQVGDASYISLIPDAQGMFSTQTYITNPWVFKSGADYVLRLSSPSTNEVISTFTITAVPFALTVRGNAQTGDQNYFAAYGNAGIGTAAPQYRLVVSSAGSAIMWVASDGVYATKFTGDGSGLTNIGVGSTATQDLDMAGYKITNAGDISGARYQIDGSTVLAILPGTGSIGIGPGAGRVNSGAYNTYLGYHAGYSNTSGIWNTFAGTNAGGSNTEGTGNTFVGLSAGAATTSGSENTFIGLNSGVYNTAGAENTFLGALTGNANTTGRYNSFVGYQAGYGNTTGWDNVFIGDGAGLSNISGSYNIGIGYDSGLASPSAYFKMSIGDVLYGDLLDRTIGIGRDVPEAALDVVSTATASDIYAQIWRNSSGVAVASMTSQGTLYATLAASGDNLGNHVATQALNMAGNQILNVSSLTVTGKDTSGYSLSLSSGIYMPNGVVSAGILNGNGAAVTNLNAANLASGTVADSRLSSNVDLLNGNQTISGVKTFTSSLTVVGTAMVSSTMSVQSIMADNLVGGIMYFAKSSCPNGFLKANGAAVSRTTYSKLYGAIGATFGAGDGSTTFNLPDLRAEFIRGVDDGRGIDSSRAFGSNQGYTVESHNHWNSGNSSPYAASVSAGGMTGVAPTTHSRGTSFYGGAETRPRNVALMGCIKF